MQRRHDVAGSKKKWFGIGAIVTAVGAGVAFVVGKSKKTGNAAADKMDDVVEASKSVVDSATETVGSAKAAVVKKFSKHTDTDQGDTEDVKVEETTGETGE
jgi:hypothetical protein